MRQQPDQLTLQATRNVQRETRNSAALGGFLLAGAVALGCASYYKGRDFDLLDFDIPEDRNAIFDGAVFASILFGLGLIDTKIRYPDSNIRTSLFLGATILSSLTAGLFETIRNTYPKFDDLVSEADYQAGIENVSGSLLLSTALMITGLYYGAQNLNYAYQRHRNEENLIANQYDDLRLRQASGDVELASGSSPQSHREIIEAEEINLEEGLATS